MLVWFCGGRPVTAEAATWSFTLEAQQIQPP